MKAIIFFHLLFWFIIKGDIIEQKIEKLENILNMKHNNSKLLINEFKKRKLFNNESTRNLTKNLKHVNISLGKSFQKYNQG